MKELEQKAIFLWMQHHRVNMAESKENIYKHAIQSVNYTIETLERVYCREWNNVKDLYNEQIELKKILEGRL